MSLIKIGVIGAGVMGQGVSYQFAKFDIQVVLIDVTEQILTDARSGIQRMHQLDLLLRKTKRSPAGISADPLTKIQFSTDYALLSEVTVVIENVPENLAIKSEVYKSIAKHVQDDVMICVNSSATSITTLSSFVSDRSRVVGMHFSNPVHLMPTVEIVRSIFTREEILDQAKALLKIVHMDAVVIRDWPGFVTNRVMLVMVNEAIFCVQENVGTADDIDAISEKCLSHKMGPLKLADLIGLDTILYSLEVLLANFNDSKYRPAPLLRKMVEAGYLGVKTKKGFYNY